jgi:hypothetical protein
MSYLSTLKHYFEKKKLHFPLKPPFQVKCVAVSFTTSVRNRLCIVSVKTSVRDIFHSDVYLAFQSGLKKKDEICVGQNVKCFY